MLGVGRFFRRAEVITKHLTTRYTQCKVSVFLSREGWPEAPLLEKPVSVTDQLSLCQASYLGKLASFQESGVNFMKSKMDFLFIGKLYQY